MHARLQSRRYPNCRKLAQEFEVSSKTVERDLDFMRYPLGSRSNMIRFTSDSITLSGFKLSQCRQSLQLCKRRFSHAGDSYQIARAPLLIAL